MAGGLGFHAASPGGGRGRGRGGPVLGMGQGSFRPLLVPVTFVKASGLTPALEGDKEKEQAPAELPQDEEPTPGELEDKVMEGQLVDVVRDLDLVDIDAGEQAEEDSRMDVEETTATVDEPRVVNVPTSIAQDLKTDQHDEDDESSGDDEQIVFHPKAEPAIAAPASAAEPPSFPPLFMIDTEPSPVQLAPATTSTSSSLPLGAPVPAPKPVPSSIASLPPPVATSIPATASSSIPTLAPKPKQSKPIAVPPPKLSKSQKAALKKAGKKARKAGKGHARSGNRHLFIEAPAGYSDDKDDLEDDQAGREMFEKMGAVDLSDDEPAAQGQEEEGEARVGDSDLEWGSGGPGEESEDEAMGASRPSGKERKLARRQQREEQRQAEKMERLTMQARSQVDRAMGEVAVSEEVEIMYGVKKSGKKGGKKGRKQIELLAAEDYERNVLGLDPSADSDEEDKYDVDLQAAEAFSRGLIGGRSGRQATLTEMEDKARDEFVASDGWRTSSGSEEGDSEVVSEEESEGSDDSVDTGDEEEMLHSLAEADA